MVFLIILIVLILLYVFLLIPRLPRRDMSALPKVDYAHRGLWNAQRPANSRSAFRSAVDAGYGIELDVHRTKDGVLVVHHDDNLKRVCGVNRRIAQSTLAEVRACHLSGTDEVVPTFDEVLTACAAPSGSGCSVTMGFGAWRASTRARCSGSGKTRRKSSADS